MKGCRISTVELDLLPALVIPIYNGVGFVKTNFPAHFVGSVFPFLIRIFFFFATKARC